MFAVDEEVGYAVGSFKPDEQAFLFPCFGDEYLFGVVAYAAFIVYLS